MIVPRKIYKHDGLLVHNDIAPYGIFVYHDVGNAPGYKPWDKLRIAEVIYLKKQKRWFFATRKITGKMKEASVGHSAVGIPDSLREEFLEAIRQLEIEHGNFAADKMVHLSRQPGLPGRDGEKLEVPGEEGTGKDEDEVDRLIGRLQGRK